LDVKAVNAAGLLAQTARRLQKMAGAKIGGAGELQDSAISKPCNLYLAHQNSLIASAIT
jgi:hypothetical protein